MDLVKGNAIDWPNECVNKIIHKEFRDSFEDKKFYNFNYNDGKGCSESVINLGEILLR